MPTDTPVNRIAKLFRDMADRVERANETEFSGAMLYVPPTGEPIAVMIVDPKPDNEAFLSLCMGKLNAVVASMQKQDGFGRR